MSRRPLALLCLPLLLAAEPPAVKEFAEVIGHVEAREVVELRARVAGYITRLNVTEGSLVKKGDLLAEIDPRPYQAAADVAAAGVGAAEARLKLAVIDVERTQRAVSIGGVSVEDKARGDALKLEAEAGVQVARAQLDIARLNLAYTRLTAPIDGRLGRVLLTPGNLVAADTTPLASLTSTGPVYVEFDVPEVAALKIIRATRGKGGPLPAAVGFAGDDGFPHAAAVDFTAGRIDPKTGTLAMRATLPNADGTLLPGQLARVRLTMPK